MFEPCRCSIAKRLRMKKQSRKWPNDEKSGKCYTLYTKAAVVGKMKSRIYERLNKYSHSDVFLVWVRSYERAPSLNFVFSLARSGSPVSMRVCVCVCVVYVFASKYIALHVYWNRWYCSRSTYLTGYVVVYNVDEKWVKMENFCATNFLYMEKALCVRVIRLYVIELQAFYAVFQCKIFFFF